MGNRNFRDANYSFLSISIFVILNLTYAVYAIVNIADFNQTVYSTLIVLTITYWIAVYSSNQIEIVNSRLIIINPLRFWELERFVELNEVTKIELFAEGGIQRIHVITQNDKKVFPISLSKSSTREFGKALEERGIDFRCEWA